MESQFQSFSRPKRGYATDMTQLGKLQRRILMWIYEQSKAAFLAAEVAEADEEEFKKISRQGVRWSSKRFLDDVPSGSDRANLSKSLRTLEKRNLIERRGLHGFQDEQRRTVWIALTNDGWRLAGFLCVTNGKSLRQIQDSPYHRARLRHITDLRRTWYERISIFDKRYNKYLENSADEATLAKYKKNVAKFLSNLADEIFEIQVQIGEPHKHLAVPKFLDNWDRPDLESAATWYNRRSWVLKKSV